ncbi:MAG: domain S-box protein [Solirubrobacterales bacterium]|nr:domain S-box protein [Solirubrobacterales bacterium]
MSEPHTRPDADRHAEELRTAQRRLIEAGDTARRQLARDLHDGAQQQLVASVISLQMAQRKWSADMPRAKELVDKALAQAESGLATLRDLVAGIHPPVLTHLGLRPAIETLAARYPIPVRLDLLDERLPPPIEASVYYFVSEGLTNTIKYANASEAAVRIAIEGGLLVVEVRDDGVGAADATRGGGGLMGLADRVSALGGDFGIASEAGAGTSLRAEIPLGSG